MFDCNQCAGMCCANPPLLRTFEEGMKAKKMGVEIVASGDSSSGYFIAIAKKKDVCPFLCTKSGDCKIYEERFEACRAFECKLIGKHEIAVMGELLADPAAALNVTETFLEKPEPLTRSQVRKIGAKIINSRNKLLQKLSATDITTFVEMASKTARMIVDHKKETA